MFWTLRADWVKIRHIMGAAQPPHAGDSLRCASRAPDAERWAAQMSRRRRDSQVRPIMKSWNAITILMILTLIVAGCAPSAKPTAVWKPAKTIHRLSTDAHLSLLWERVIYTEVDEFGLPCAALDGFLFVNASEQPTGNLHLIAIDQDGNTKWSLESGLHLAHSQTQLFIGNGATVTAISPQNGDVEWSTLLPLASYVYDLFYFEDQLFVGSKSYPFVVISPTDGKIIAKYASVDNFRNANPHVPFYPTENFQPLVIGEEAIIQVGDILYTFLRWNPSSDDRIWRVDDDAISNATLIGDLLFYVAKDDKLKAINVATGELVFETAIQPSFEFFNLAKDVQHDGYYVCSDDNYGRLYVILGDSRQLLAFSVSE